MLIELPFTMTNKLLELQQLVKLIDAKITLQKVLELIGSFLTELTG